MDEAMEKRWRELSEEVLNGMRRLSESASHVLLLLVFSVLTHPICRSTCVCLIKKE